MLRVPLILPIALIAAACDGPIGNNSSENTAAIIDSIDTSNATDPSPVPDPAIANDRAPGTTAPTPPAASDRTPVAETPFSEASAQGAANVVQTYYALLEEGKTNEAYRLWSDGGKASGLSEADFAKSFDKYDEYHANVGAPGPVEGAAGSAYVEIPVQVYGTLKSGRDFNMRGPLRLRRVNDVDGSTAEQRRWHIYESGIRPRP